MRPSVPFVALLVFAAHTASAQTVPSHEAADRLHHDHAAYMAALDDPARDGWQKPKEVVTALGLAHGHVVADIGAGSGYFALRFAHHVGAGGKVLAVDIAPQMLEELGRRASAAGLSNVTTVLARPDDPLLPAAGVDVIFTCNTWHHIGGRTAYLGRLKQALAPGGRLVIVDFHKDAPVGPPATMKLARELVVDEVRKAGFTLKDEPTFLPHQYFLVFEPS
jgi:ubiquinone/menaquinone biosynthesis C-methylase UbiE